jgi:GPI mannosyltransferase 3
LKYAVAGIMIAAPLLGLMILMDSLFYGKLTFTFINFLEFNVLTGGSEAYGVEHDYFYVVQSVSDIAKNLALPFYVGILISIKNIFSKKWYPEASLIYCFYVVVFSQIRHKET